MRVTIESTEERRGVTVEIEGVVNIDDALELVCDALKGYSFSEKTIEDGILGLAAAIEDRRNS